MAGPTFNMGAQRRKMSFIESVIEHGIPMSDVKIVDDNSKSYGYAAAIEILRDPKTRPTAVLCFNDVVAMGVYRAAYELSLDIPGDLSVVGFDGIEAAELMGPPLTTVNIFPEELGRQAANILLRVIRNETGREIVTHWVDTELVKRASVRDLNADRLGAGLRGAGAAIQQG